MSTAFLPQPYKGLASSERPRIMMKGGSIFHSGQKYPTRVVFRKNLISVGCIDITVEAAQYILDQHAKAFPQEDTEKVFQDGTQYNVQ